MPEPFQQPVTPEVKDEVWNSLKAQSLNSLLLGLGAGVGGRGLLSLYDMVRNGGKKEKRPATAPLPIEVLPAEKIAAEPSWYDTAKDILATPSRLTDIWRGNYAKSVSAHPYGVPSIYGAAVLGAIGGWKGTDYLVNKQKQLEREQELAAAKKEYEAALSNKTASALGRDLDRIYEQLEKQAAGEQMLGTLMGIALTAAGTLSAYGANKGWEHAKSRQPAALLAKAKEQRRREMAQQRPSSPYAVPPIPEEILE